jgi:hypothetical protein
MAISERQDGKLAVVAIRASPPKKPTYEAACFASRNHTWCSWGLKGPFQCLEGRKHFDATLDTTICAEFCQARKAFPLKGIGSELPRYGWLSM